MISNKAQILALKKKKQRESRRIFWKIFAYTVLDLILVWATLGVILEGWWGLSSLLALGLIYLQALNLIKVAKLLSKVY